MQQQTTKTRRSATRPADGPAMFGPGWWNFEERLDPQSRPTAPAPLDWPIPADDEPADFLEPLTVGAPADPGRPADNDDAAEALTPASGRPAEQAPAEHAPAVQPTPATLPAAKRPAAAPAIAEQDRPAEWRPMTGWQKFFGLVLAPPALTLGGFGFVISFETVVARMASTFGERAWMVPIGVDLGILVFAGVHIWLAAIGMRMGWLRLVPWLLTAATILLNATSHVTDIATVGAHTVLPLLWVIVCEVIAHLVAVRTGMRRGERSDPIPLIRWLIDPWNTLLLWRNMRLWGIRSYKRATALERERLLVRTRLREVFPRRPWNRWTASVPPMLLTRYRLRELTLADVEAALTIRAAEDITATAVTVRAEATATPRPLPAVATDEKATPKPRPPGPRGRDYRADMAKAFKEFVATHNGEWPNGTQLKDAAKVSRTAAKNWLAAKRREVAA